MAAKRTRARRPRQSLATNEGEALKSQVAPATMEETLSGPRLVSGRRLSARQIKRLIDAGR